MIFIKTGCRKAINCLQKHLGVCALTQFVGIGPRKILQNGPELIVSSLNSPGLGLRAREPSTRSPENAVRHGRSVMPSSWHAKRIEL
jgi:hypothetical protein